MSNGHRPIFLLHPVLVLAPLVMWRMRLLPGWPLRTGPAWIVPVVAVLALSDIVLAFVMERQFLRGPTADRLRAKGRDPEQDMALIGSVMLLAPVCWALFASFVGLPLAQLVFYALLSTAGVAYWGWRYRHVIYRRSTQR